MLSVSMYFVATVTMTNIFKQVQQDNFYCLPKMIKIDVFFITQPTKFIGSTCTASQKYRASFLDKD